MHYIEAGSGEPVVLLHGNPTSSYLWRHVIPHVAPHARCIAPDLMGMGYSDKPHGAYRFDDHYAYLRAFIDALDLTRVTFVAHDWGGSLAFCYAADHPERVRALAFMEVMLAPLTWAEMPWHFRPGFRLMRTPGIGWLMLSLANLFVNLVLPIATARRLDRLTMARYRAPFRRIASRRPVRQWPCEIPLDGRPADNDAKFLAYSRFLQASRLPKLLCYSEPGALIREPRRRWAQQSLPNLETCCLGKGSHFAPEEHPEAIGRAVTDWYRSQVLP
jgi:haloalkane dehalogenase